MDNLHNRFTYHPPTGDQPETYRLIRGWGLDFATALDDLGVPESREKSLAVTKIEEAVFWANAAIARNSHD